MTKYNKRIWLNPESSHFTGSLVCHDGIVSNQGKPPERYTFVELASCHGKVRLHTDKNSGREVQQLAEFIAKINLMQNELQKFREYLFEEMLKLEEAIENE